eukprot:m.1051207 g.1051207  ORF g.1051207 m.1051207 type:complete len:110 (+) comp24176_c0_seq34:2369-2698(+)
MFPVCAPQHRPQQGVHRAAHAQPQPHPQHPATGGQASSTETPTSAVGGSSPHATAQRRPQRQRQNLDTRGKSAHRGVAPRYSHKRNRPSTSVFGQGRGYSMLSTEDEDA